MIPKFSGKTYDVVELKMNLRSVWSLNRWEKKRALPSKPARISNILRELEMQDRVLLTMDEQPSDTKSGRIGKMPE